MYTLWTSVLGFRIWSRGTSYCCPHMQKRFQMRVWGHPNFTNFCCKIHQSRCYRLFGENVTGGIPDLSVVWYRAVTLETLLGRNELLIMIISSAVHGDFVRWWDYYRKFLKQLQVSFRFLRFLLFISVKDMKNLPNLLLKATEFDGPAPFVRTWTACRDFLQTAGPSPAKKKARRWVRVFISLWFARQMQHGSVTPLRTGTQQFFNAK